MIEPLRFPAPPKPDSVEIRQLTDEEVASLAPEFATNNAPMPNPPYTAVGIVADGKIVGYQFLQLKCHVQPTSINKGYAHLFKALCRKTESILQERVGSVWVYVFAMPGRMAALAESCGMTVEPWCVLSRQIGSTVNAQMAAEPLVPIPVAEPGIPVTEEEMEMYPGIDAKALTEAIQ